MSRPSPAVKKRYNDATMRIAFSLNKAETEQVKQSLTQKEANAIAKRLFLAYINHSDEVNRQQYEQLTPEQQKTLSERIRQIIKDFLKGGE